MLWQTAQLPGHVRQNVHRIRYNQQNCVRTVFDQRRNDALENVRIALDQRQSIFADSLSCARRHDAQPRAGRHRQVSGAGDFRVLHETRAVLQVE